MSPTTKLLSGAFQGSGSQRKSVYFPSQCRDVIKETFFNDLKSMVKLKQLWRNNKTKQLDSHEFSTFEILVFFLLSDMCS